MKIILSLIIQLEDSNQTGSHLPQLIVAITENLRKCKGSHSGRLSKKLTAQEPSSKNNIEFLTSYSGAQTKGSPLVVKFSLKKIQNMKSDTADFFLIKTIPLRNCPQFIFFLEYLELI